MSMSSLSQCPDCWNYHEGGLRCGQDKASTGLADEYITKRIIVGRIEPRISSGQTLPPGAAWHVTDGILQLNLSQVFQAFEGKKVEITITVLEEAPAEPRRPRTIRDLTEPR